MECESLIMMFSFSEEQSQPFPNNNGNDERSANIGFPSSNKSVERAVSSSSRVLGQYSPSLPHFLSTKEIIQEENTYITQLH